MKSLPFFNKPRSHNHQYQTLAEFQPHPSGGTPPFLMTERGKGLSTNTPLSLLSNYPQITIAVLY